MVTNTYINEQMKGYKLDNTKFFWRVTKINGTRLNNINV